MTTYTVYFRSYTAWACGELEAKTPEKALALAQELGADGKLDLLFEPYDVTSNVNEIVVSDDDGNELAFWYDEEKTLHLAAQDLLDACEMILDADGDLYAIDFDMIRAAIAKAKGGAV